MNARRTPELPIAAIRADVLAARGPLVITAPTGSGKSTEVPRYCLERGDSVVVVEPRRVACRALAARVAELEGARLGELVGYQVRDDVRISDATRLRFITPGIALRQLEALRAADVVILDELHERRLDVDLLLALLRDEGPQLITMSATLDAERVRAYLEGTHLEAAGSLYPVEVRYRDAGHTLPTSHDLTERVLGAIHDLLAEDAPGDVLVFLPGKGEIAELQTALRGRPLEVVPLHGGLPLDQQARVFRAAKRRKVILSTNVAETSLTVPGIGAVIDSGLVRRTAYHRGRAFLALHSVAADAADQRSGRAGRTGPGIAIRLWARRAELDAHTPPEVHRESLVPLVLGAAAAGKRVDALRFLDDPKEHALEAARDELRTLGALDPEGAVTDVGLGLHGLPLDAPLGRLLLAARDDTPATLQDAVDLVAALSVGRPFFSGPPGREPSDPRSGGCDATARVRAVRGEGSDPARREARRVASRLREVLGLGPATEPVDAAALRRIALRADPRTAHVARRRKHRVAFSNGGTEVDLARESAAWLAVEPERGRSEAEALVVFEERAFGRGRDRRLLATCASPVSIAELREADLGRDRVGAARVKKGVVVATIERVHAGRVLSEREAVPEGDAAREAIAELFADGRLHRKSRDESARRLQRRALAARLSQTRLGREQGLPPMDPPPTLEAWIRAHLQDLGVESGRDLKLLGAGDFLAEDLGFEVRHLIDDTFPTEVDLGDARYRARYDLEKRRVLLELVHGRRTKPPSKAFLPGFGGLTIFVEAGGTLHRVR